LCWGENYKTGHIEQFAGKEKKKKNGEKKREKGGGGEKRVRGETHQKSRNESYGGGICQPYRKWTQEKKKEKKGGKKKR